MSRQLVMRLHQEPLIVDSFAGGGGASLGIEMALGRSPDIAINHDAEAIAMHAENHPSTRHYCESVWKVDPVEVTRGRPIALAWFSPDCTFHSNARGSRPFRDPDHAKRRRGLAWLVTRWARAVKPRVICLENVQEFADWGPLDDATGRPDPARRGFTFRRWWAQLENCGYCVEMRMLRACDYGAPTTRRRLFIVARCDGERIVWPEATHGDGRAPFRTAAECVDWSDLGTSIFDRREPLVEATLRRIARGMHKYVLGEEEPFLVGNVSPSMVQIGWGERKTQAPRCLDIRQPIGTLMAGGIKHALVAAFIAKHYSERKGGGFVGGASLRHPLSTITTRDHHALVSAVSGDRSDKVRAFLRQYSEDSPRRDIEISDINMRSLLPRELYRAQGFPDDYRIDFTVSGAPLSKTAQVRMVGNSVSPPVAAALVSANIAVMARRRVA